MAVAISEPVSAARGSVVEQRWLQLTIGVVAMMAISPDHVLHVFYIVIALDVATAIAALALLKPMRSRWLQRA